MKIIKSEILKNICYTDLVYGRINKKLGLNHTNHEIERFIYRIIDDAHIENFKIIGKNYYIENYEENIRLTINCNTYRIITADRIKIAKW